MTPDRNFHKVQLFDLRKKKVIRRLRCHHAEVHYGDYRIHFGCRGDLHISVRGVEYTTIPVLNIGKHLPNSRHGYHSTKLLEYIGEGFLGVDLQFRRDGTSWPEVWKARCLSWKHEFARRVVFGNTAEEAIAKLYDAVWGGYFDDEKP